MQTANLNVDSPNQHLKRLYRVITICASLEGVTRGIARSLCSLDFVVRKGVGIPCVLALRVDDSDGKFDG